MIKMRPQRRQQLGNCPSGKTYYRCALGPFTGCCSTNPCDTGVCRDAAEGSQETTPSSRIMLVSSATAVHLDSATASSPVSQSTSVGSGSGTASTSSTGGSKTLTSSHSSTSNRASASTTDPSPDATTSVIPGAGPVKSNKPSGGPIAGGIIGGLAFLALLALLARYLRRKTKLQIKVKREKKEEKKEEKDQAKAEETQLLERQKYLEAARNRIQQNESGSGGGPFPDFGGSSNYPKNSTAHPPPRWG